MGFVKPFDVSMKALGFQNSMAMTVNSMEMVSVCEYFGIHRNVFFGFFKIQDSKKHQLITDPSET